jgi:hypothetical protein
MLSTDLRKIATCAPSICAEVTVYFLFKYRLPYLCWFLSIDAAPSGAK